MKDKIDIFINDKDNNNQYLCAQLRGQQLLTSYPGFSKEVKNVRSEEEENIRLKIEEKLQQLTNTPESEEEELEKLRKKKKGKYRILLRTFAFRL